LDCEIARVNGPLKFDCEIARVNGSSKMDCEIARVNGPSKMDCEIARVNGPLSIKIFDFLRMKSGNLKRETNLLTTTEQTTFSCDVATRRLRRRFFRRFTRADVNVKLFLLLCFLSG
jgi:hypothetical protein